MYPSPNIAVNADARERASVRRCAINHAVPASRTSPLAVAGYLNVERHFLNRRIENAE